MDCDFEPTVADLTEVNKTENHLNQKVQISSLLKCQKSWSFYPVQLRIEIFILTLRKKTITFHYFHLNTLFWDIQTLLKNILLHSTEVDPTYYFHKKIPTFHAQTARDCLLVLEKINLWLWCSFW